MVSFDEFLQEARDNIDAFEKAWKEGHAANEHIFPMEISEDNAGIWWEQLHEFDQGGK